MKEAFKNIGNAIVRFFKKFWQYIAIAFISVISILGLSIGKKAIENYDKKKKDQLNQAVDNAKTEQEHVSSSVNSASDLLNGLKEDISTDKNNGKENNSTYVSNQTENAENAGFTKKERGNK